MIMLIIFPLLYLYQKKGTTYAAAIHSRLLFSVINQAPTGGRCFYNEKVPATTRTRRFRVSLKTWG